MRFSRRFGVVCAGIPRSIHFLGDGLRIMIMYRTSDDHTLRYAYVGPSRRLHHFLSGEVRILGGLPFIEERGEVGFVTIIRHR